MAWMNMLYRTYEANAGLAGSTDERVPLSLVAHMSANAQLEIYINMDGHFAGATPVDKENAKTIIPVTEASSSRSSGAAPHALCDTLSYIAGDFGNYLSEEKAAKKAQEKFSKYITALESWNASPYTHPKLQAIFKYISEKRMTYDLIEAGILMCGEDGTLSSDKKVNGAVYEKALVRFRVFGSSPDAVWEDSSLLDSYTKYYLSSQSAVRDICYLKGESDAISTNHPKGIIAATYGAKLLSANDTANFTFRGRFNTAEEACAISYQASQKAHSALTWLAAKQGVYVGKTDRRTYICWNPNGKRVADISDPLGLVDDSQAASSTEEEYKKRLIRTLNGYRGELDNNDDIVVIGLEAATPGRLSVIYYNELKSSDFYDRLTHWGETCCWYFTKFTQDKKPYTVVQTPFTKPIVDCAFGTEQGNFLETGDKILKEQYQRLLFCILDRKPVPADFVHALAIRASMPQAYSRGNHERTLSTACALIAKYYNDQPKGVKIKMALDKTNEDKDYLFGRLLAVLEKAERSTYGREENREPNAIRLQSVYVRHPMSTWKTLETALNPYFQRMAVGSRYFYKDLISEIADKISISDADKLNKPLGDTYLIGYYLQRMELNKFKGSIENKWEEAAL